MKTESLLSSAFSSASPLSNKLCPSLLSHTLRLHCSVGAKAEEWAALCAKGLASLRNQEKGDHGTRREWRQQQGKLENQGQVYMLWHNAVKGQWGRLDISVGYEMTSVHSLLVDAGGIIRVLPEPRGGSKEMRVTVEEMYISRYRCRHRATYSWDWYKYIIHVCFHG